MVLAASDEAINLTHLPYAMDEGVGGRARIGLVVLATDFTIEHEWRLIMGGIDGVGLYHARLLNDSSITPETLAAMAMRITPAAGLLLPGNAFDVVAYGCTSGTMVIGEERVMELIRAAKPEAKGTTPVTGALAAFRALGARRIALLTPYRDDINQNLRRFFEGRGIGVAAMGSFNEEDDGKVGRMTPHSVRDAAIELARHDGVDAVFVSCTSLRLAEVAVEIEAATGKPATSSNHAMAWHALRLAGIDDRLPQWGRLFERGLDA